MREPQTHGRRSGSPPLLKVVQGGGDAFKVLLCLLDEHERQSFSRAFADLGWQVSESDYDMLMMDVFANEPHLLLTDSISEIPEVRSAPVGELTIVVITFAVAEAAALEAGADFVLLRPIDLDDPLGWSRAGRNPRL